MRVFLIFALSIFYTLGYAEVFAADVDTASDKYKAFKRFSSVYDMVKENYVLELTDDEILEGAVKGMLQNLDPHSRYLTKEEYKEMNDTTSGKFYGVGIEISSENNQLLIISPIEDTPGDKAGLKAGDQILAVDGLSTKDMSAHEAVSKIRGEKGTPVELLILSKGSNTPRIVKIIRDAIPLRSVKANFIDDDGILWIRLTYFNEDTFKELSKAITAESKKSKIEGIVLDLRNNPGGLLDQATAISDMFLSSGEIVSISGRYKEETRSFKATKDKSDITVPVVVLINSGSASASEIVAGALQDHNRAVIIGEQSFGKGSVQQIVPLPDESAVKLTIARFYTPSGRSIQAEGIVPDILVPFEAVKEVDESITFNGVNEKDLDGHLENIQKKTDDKNKDKKQLVEEDTAKRLAKDNQLRMGLQILKGLPRLQEIGKK